MANQELVMTLDYILNRCNEQDIDIVAAAIVRRRRDISMFGSMPAIPDPRRMSEEISSQLNMEGNIEGLKDSVKDYAIRIIKKQAPELTEAQIEELTQSWIPDFPGKKTKGPAKSAIPEGNLDPNRSRRQVPKDLLVSMIGQFISFSLGRMEEKEDQALRKEMGTWPDKYWKAFPKVIRLLITDLLKGEIDEADFNARVGLALQMK